MHQPVPAERYFANSPALPVAQACQHDDAQGVVQALQSTHVSPNSVGEQGMSLLLLAMSNRSNKAVEALLTHGADPNLISKLGSSQEIVQPVALAAGGDNTELLRLLLDHKGNSDARFGNRTALFCATYALRFDNMHLLVEYNADINSVDENGVPLIVLMAALRHFDQVVYLLGKGANIHKADKLGYTLAFELQRQGFDYTPSFPPYQDVVKAKHLLEAQGIHFPVPSPVVAQTAQERVENAQRRQWEVTVEGHRWLDPIHQAERLRELNQDPAENYTRAQDLRLRAEEAFQAWRKTQPGWVPSVNFVSRYYQDPPTLAQEAVDMHQRREKAQADSARWAEQARAIH